ncbi:MAG: HRDC domain-containing protein, partial [Clostridiales bacterium]|nr:HRDC domain-containing protein [Clostridiales bacterium]
MDENLYKQLETLRNTLRQTPENGKRPNVCSDASLLELARLVPKSKEELMCVHGLGRVFAEKYGDAFMEVLGAYRASSVKERLLTPHVRSTLKNLETRLVAVNKRNRLLYMPKIGTHAVDLVQNDRAFNNRLSTFIKRFEGDKKLSICKLDGSDKETKRYKRLNALLRETDRVKRESGESELFIAYPFAVGKVPGENFPIRAPLVLFPVECIVSNEGVSLRMAAERDVIYNTSLILSFNKFYGKNEPLPLAELEEIPNALFFSQTAAFYKEHGIELITCADELQTFTEYSANEFAKIPAGTFTIEPCAVLGRFPLYSGALQQDFRRITESETVNPLLNDLLQRYEDVDIYSDSEEFGEQPLVSRFPERALSYLGDLNISQEAAIFNIEQRNKLVIQGPPGTGKSQTIASMIADFVNDGKNVLMVSQKKAALDVIYSRLGKLSELCLFVHDVKDKDGFYAQIESMLRTNEAAVSPVTQFNTVSDAVDADLKNLEALGDTLFYDRKYGASMAEIYRKATRDPFRKDDTVLVEDYLASTPTDFFSMGIARIEETVQEVGDPFTAESALKFADLAEQDDWMLSLKPDLTDMESAAAVAQMKEVVDLFVEYKNAKIFRRGKAKRMYKKALRAFVASAFVAPPKNFYKQFFKDPTALYNGVKNRPAFFRYKEVYDRLSGEAKLTFGVARNVAARRDETFEDALCRIVPFALYYYINEFEAISGDTLSAVLGFDKTLSHILGNLDKKKELSRTMMKATLLDAVRSSLQMSKRRGDMLRIAESKRRWNVPRFVDKFAFELFNGIKVWLMTPETVSQLLPLESDLFDLLIFDEASQIYIEKGVPAIVRAKKVVIAGDHKQLRPSSLGSGRITYDEWEEEEAEAALEEESLLDLARFKYPELMLDFHYRSKYEELIDFSNYAFYRGRLNVSPNVCPSAQPPIRVYKVDGLWESRHNYAEADVVVSLLRERLKNNPDRDTMGVITFNSEQRDYILDKIDDLRRRDPAFAAAYDAEANRKENGEDIGLFVKNIENVQGDERDCIIFSTAYAKDANGRFIRNFGWLNQTGGENRLNVAISRARKHIDLVTSILPNDLRVDDLAGDGPLFFRKYLEYAY